jgi:hypothetical protein
MTVKLLRHFLNMTIKSKYLFDQTKDMAAANTSLAKVAVSFSASINVVKIATFTKPENVTPL